MGCIIKYKKQSIPEEQFLQYLNKQIAINNLFETNGDFASKIYEALGFKTKTSTNEITRAIKEELPFKVFGNYSDIEDGLRGRRYYETTIDNNVYRFEISNFSYENEDGSYNSFFDIDFTVNGSENLVGLGFFDKAEKAKQIIQALLSQNYGNDTVRFVVEDSKKGKQRLLLYERLMNQLGYESFEKNNEALFYNIKIDKVNLTPQQKQQALQLYSSYLNTIFPNSKVKDIVYHGTNAEFEDFFEDALNYFTISKDVAEKAGKYGNNVKYIKSVLLDIRRPFYEDYGNLSLNDYSELENQLNESNSDGYISLDERAFVPQTTEQIHILGSKQDIEGFKEFVSGETTKEEAPPFYEMSAEEREQRFQDFYKNNQNISEEEAREYFNKCMI